MGVNVMGTSFCSKYAVQAMKRQGSGSIVNVASINGLIAMADWMTYNASKAAIVEISKSMSLDLGPFNIRVNCVCPGVTLTPALERVFVEYQVEPDQAVQDFIAHRCHIKRFGTADEIASAILFVSSDEASYMTGSTLVVDGGYSA
jgi:NAD(P)-dependent dehydrogenase (short-subunit alcohol dehydrogenase family)